MQQWIRCPRCGANNAPGQRFCNACGTPLPTGCANCGTLLNPGATFCPRCGMPSAPQQGGYYQPPPPGYPPQQPNYGYAPQPQNYGQPQSGSGSRYSPYGYRSSSYQSRYSQPSASGYRQSTYASKYSQPQPNYRQPQGGGGYSRPAAPSKTCSHCKRAVRADQNICPYCNKRV